MLLNGAADAAVNGGPTKYRDAFLLPEYVQAYPAVAANVAQLREVRTSFVLSCAVDIDISPRSIAL